MATQNKQIVRLVYESKAAFEASSTGQQNLSAFIIEEGAPPAVGIRAGDGVSYIQDQTAAVDQLEATLALHAAHIATLAAQIGNASGVNPLGSTNAPRTIASGYSSHGLPYATPEGTTNPMSAVSCVIQFNFPGTPWAGQVHVGTPAVAYANSAEFHYRVVSGGVRAYPTYEDAVNDTNHLAEADPGSAETGFWPFVMPDGKTWGWLELTADGIAFPGHVDLLFYAIPERHDYRMSLVSFVPGARFEFEFTLGADWDTDATEIGFEFGLFQQALPTFTFPIPGTFSGLVRGKLTVNLDYNPVGPAYVFRARMELDANFPDGFRNSAGGDGYGERLSQIGLEYLVSEPYLRAEVNVPSAYGSVSSLMLLDAALTMYPPAAPIV